MSSLFNYVELHSPDAAKAQGFYGELFGWKFERAKVPDVTYFNVQGGGDARGGLQQGPATPHWLPYVDVKDVSATVAQATRLGAVVKQPVTKIPVGQYAVLADPTGAVFALFQPA